MLSRQTALIRSLAKGLWKDHSVLHIAVKYFTSCAASFHLKIWHSFPTIVTVAFGTVPYASGRPDHLRRKNQKSQKENIKTSIMGRDDSTRKCSAVVSRLTDRNPRDRQNATVWRHSSKLNPSAERFLDCLFISVRGMGGGAWG